MVDCILRLSQFHKPGVQLVHFPALLGSLICVHRRPIESPKYPDDLFRLLVRGDKAECVPASLRFSLGEFPRCRSARQCAYPHPRSWGSRSLPVAEA